MRIVLKRTPIEETAHKVMTGLGRTLALAATLVLTLVELLRQLMERQAIRRVDHGDLTDEQVERIGTTLMLLEEKMIVLREHFGLEPEDLNIDLGPLGPLLAKDP